MTYIENIFLCLALPMLLSLLFTSGSPRRFTLFVVLGMATCLLSAYVSSFFMGRHQCSAVTTAIEIAPVCEEILKLLPHPANRWQRKSATGAECFDRRAFLRWWRSCSAAPSPG